MDLDDIYSQIGEFGPRQKLYFFSIAIFNFYSPFNLIQIVFTGQTPSFICFGPNGTAFQDQCPHDDISTCEKIEYLSRPDSFAREWNLICDQAYKINMIQSVYMAGVMVGALIFGPVADRCGRKPTLLGTTIGIVLSGILSSCASAYVYYTIARFFTGIFGAGNMLALFVLASELVGASTRGFCGNIIQVAFAFGIIAYSALGYFVRRWRDLSLISSAIGGIFLFPLLWIPESPRWLIGNNKLEAATTILCRIAVSNKKALPVGVVVSARQHVEAGNLVGTSHPFHNSKICIATFIQLFSWFVNSVVYYGLTLAAGTLGSNIYMSEALSGLVELPAYIAAIFLIEWAGRRNSLAGFMIMGGVSCLIVKWSICIVFPLLGKMAIAASFSIIYIHSTELFPTVLRNSGLGLCSCFARIGGVVSPMTSFANSVTSSGQFLLLGLLALSSGMLNMWLPETLNKPMPETIQDLERLLSTTYTELQIDHESSDED